jgi:preprotein translocase subunit YajC
MNALTLFAQEGSIWGMLFPFLIIIPLFYIMLIRPAQRRERERQAMLQSLQKNDDVILAGGIIGKVISIDKGGGITGNEDIVKVKVDEKVKLDVLRSSVIRIWRPGMEQPQTQAQTAPTPASTQTGS